MEVWICSERRNVEKFLDQKWKIYTQAQGHVGAIVAQSLLRCNRNRKGALSLGRIAGKNRAKGNYAGLTHVWFLAQGVIKWKLGTSNLDWIGTCGRDLLRRMQTSVHNDLNSADCRQSSRQHYHPRFGPGSMSLQGGNVDPWAKRTVGHFSRGSLQLLGKFTIIDRKAQFCLNLWAVILEMHLVACLNSWLPFAVFLGMESRLIKSLFVITHRNLHPSIPFSSLHPHLLLLALASLFGIIIK